MKAHALRHVVSLSANHRLPTHLAQRVYGKYISVLLTMAKLRRVRPAHEEKPPFGQKEGIGKLLISFSAIGLVP
jgi:hypothetical protein